MHKKNLSVKYETYADLTGNKERFVRQVGDGSIIKRFDKTPIPKNKKDVICPHFLELKWAYGCPYRCSWCYLQGTLRLLPTKTKPIIKSYQKIQSHLESFFIETANNGSASEILNSGEIADSLMYENNGSPFSRFIASLFDSQKKHKVLFLSKSDNVDNIIKTKSENIIPSFTLNAHSVASRWEHGAPDVKKRIDAAKKLTDNGYQVRIRIDPLVPVVGWEKGYQSLLDDIFSNFEPERITLGSLRGLNSTVINAHDKTWCIYLSESSGWGKKIASEQRYIMYQNIINHMRKDYGYNKIALCKETKEIWEKLSMDYTKIKCNCVW